MSYKKPLILVGGGGHCKSVIEAVQSSGRTVKGILDMPEFVGQTILDIKVVGTEDDVHKYVDECLFVVTLGSIKTAKHRIRLHNMIQKAGGAFATVIASTAHVSKHATLGEGTVVLHHANVNAGAVVGRSVIINSCANIEHDAQIGDFCHISTGVMINGDCKIGRETFIGSQAVVVNGRTITGTCVVGAGSLVNRNLTQSGIYYGSPALLREKAIGGG